MIQTEYRLGSVGVSVGPAYFPSKTKNESEALSETDGLCSSEHGFWMILGYRFVRVPYRLCRFRELPQSSRRNATLQGQLENL